MQILVLPSTVWLGLLTQIISPGMINGTPLRWARTWNPILLKDLFQEQEFPLCRVVIEGRSCTTRYVVDIRRLPSF